MIAGATEKRDVIKPNRNSNGRGPQRFKWLVVVSLTLAVCLPLWSCKKAESPPAESAEPPSSQADPSAPSAADPLDLSALKAAFSSARPALRVYVDEAIAVIHTRAYADGIEQLQKVSKHPDLTAAQLQAVQDMIAKLRPFAAGQPR